MPAVIAHHEVKDTEHWLSSPKHEEVLGPLGAKRDRGSGACVTLGVASQLALVRHSNCRTAPPTKEEHRAESPA